MGALRAVGVLGAVSGLVGNVSHPADNNIAIAQATPGPNFDKFIVRFLVCWRRKFVADRARTVFRDFDLGPVFGKIGVDYPHFVFAFW